VVWDRATGEPIHRAIVWQDRRTAARCRELEADGAEAGAGADGAGHRPLLLGHQAGVAPGPRADGARERAEAGELAAGTIDSWLIWKLTGGRVHATDPTNASRTMLYNIDRGDWDDELLDLLRVPRAALPEVRPSSGVFGETEAGSSGPHPRGGRGGRPAGRPLRSGVLAPGARQEHVRHRRVPPAAHRGDERIASGSGLLTTVACDAAGQPAYALEGAIFVAGAAVQWLRDGLGLLETPRRPPGWPRELESNDGVYFVPAFVGLGAPHWEPEARGTIVGLTRGTDARHLARAALEAMAYSTRDVLLAMEQDSGVTAGSWPWTAAPPRTTG
jgi:glycerol kinase